MEKNHVVLNTSLFDRKNSFSVFNHIKLELIEPDHAVISLDIRPESRNPYGFVHGGALYTMADNATGYAAHTDGRCYVTQDSTIHFLGNQAEGVIRADAHVRHRGRSTCLVDVDIFGDGEKLLATGEFTFFCVDREQLLQRAGK